MAPRTPSSKRRELLELLDIAEQVRKRSRVLKGPEKKESLAWIRECRALARSTSGAAGRSSLQRDLLVEWNEGVGPDIEEFWRRVREAGLPIRRGRDVVMETLARGRIASMDEFVVLEDNFEVLQTTGKIDGAQADALNRMLDEFMDAPENQRYFEGGDQPAGRGDVLGSDDDGVEIGQLVRVSAHEYRYDYTGAELSAFLRKKGFQGGGDSWAGIASALLKMLAPDVLPVVRMDPESGCLAIWASDPAPLKAASSLIARATRERPLLMRAIAKAEEDSEME